MSESTTDFRENHEAELREKQRHIAQKISQLEEYAELVRTWRREFAQLDSWLSSLDTSLDGTKHFSIGALIRLGSVSVKIQEMIAAFGQVGDPKSTGTGTATSGSAGSTGVPTGATVAAGSSTSPSGESSESDSMTPQELHGVASSLLSDRAGPLATMAPWELVWHIDPATSESVRQGEYFVAVVNVLSNPFTSQAGQGFAEGIGDEALRILAEEAETFDSLESSWGDATDALDGIRSGLDGIDLDEIERLKTELGQSLSDMERAFDRASGDGPYSGEVRRAAAGN